MVVIRAMEIGLGTILMIILISVSCVMTKACPSGFGDSSGVNNVHNVQGDDGNVAASSGQKMKQTEVSKNTIVKTTTTTTPEPEVVEVDKYPKTVTIFTSPNHSGRSAVLTFTEKRCKNLPDYIKNRVQSVNTEGHCVTLCDLADCGGWCMNFQPGSPSHHRFRKLRFHNRAESAIPCTPTPQDY